MTRDDPSTLIHWRVPAAILATLFLNVGFWVDTAGGFWMVWPLPLYALLLAGVVVLVTALAVVGPWLAACGGKSLSALVEASFGALPAHLVRWVCVAFSVVWLSAAVSLPVRLWFLFTEERPLWQAYTLAVGLVAFLCYTGLQSLITEAKLGLFTSKLGVAVLVAALWRVRDGWPAIPAGFEQPLPVFWSGFSQLAAYVVPFGLLAADLASQLRGRRDIAWAATAGIAVPLFGSVLLTAIIAVATARSPLYQPSLNPTVPMALFSKVASSALPGRWAIAAVTVFGAARFCIRSMSVAMPIKTVKWKWAAVVLLCAGACWLSLHFFASSFRIAVNFLANCLGVMSAIITADWLLCRRPAPRRIDWTGCVVFGVGLLPMCAPHDSWHPRLLPCCVVAFVACIVGRTLERAIRP